jgi:outer membrane murein-binding lipoprotein Lpp
MSARPTARVSLAALAGSLALAGCASSVSVSRFKGEEREVAQTIANLQSDTGSQDQARVCANDLARAIVQRLNQAPGGCEQAIKRQQAEIDPGLEVTVESVRIGGSASARTATASVKSTFEGKRRLATLLLVKEDGKWKLSGLQ